MGYVYQILSRVDFCSPYLRAGQKKPILNRVKWIQRKIINNKYYRCQNHLTGLYFAEDSFHWSKFIAIHVTYSFRGLLVFFWLTLVDMLCLKLEFSVHQNTYFTQYCTQIHTSTPKEANNKIKIRDISTIDRYWCLKIMPV